MRLRALLDFFGSLETAWQAPLDGLRSAGLPGRILENLLKVRNEVSLEKIWTNIERQGFTVLTWEDEDYPKRLMQIDQPPPVMFLSGNILPEDDWSMAVVGTRRLTGYGRQVAEELGAFLAHHKITVVSGLARGIDRIAHEAALKAGGRTLAVLGSGVDKIYPPEHKGLAEQIKEHGAVISDYPLGTQPESTNFPPRNRIISGLSRGVVVIEAGETSGALITATFAAEQGREVFAVPGSIYSPSSKGTNRLIVQGAHPLAKFDQILEELKLGSVPEHFEARSLLPDNDIEMKLLVLLSAEPHHVDDICALSGLPIEQVSATLTIMELKGMVRQTGGMNFSAIREDHSDYRINENA